MKDMGCSDGENQRVGYIGFLKFIGLGISEKRNVCFGPAERSFRLKRNSETSFAVVNR